MSLSKSKRFFTELKMRFVQAYGNNPKFVYNVLFGLFVFIIALVVWQLAKVKDFKTHIISEIEKLPDDKKLDTLGRLLNNESITFKSFPFVTSYIVTPNSSLTTPSNPLQYFPNWSSDNEVKVIMGYGDFFFIKRRGEESWRKDTLSKYIGEDFSAITIDYIEGTGFYIKSASEIDYFETPRYREPLTFYVHVDYKTSGLLQISPASVNYIKIPKDSSGLCECYTSYSPPWWTQFTPGKDSTKIKFYYKQALGAKPQSVLREIKTVKYPDSLLAADGSFWIMMDHDGKANLKTLADSPDSSFLMKEIKSGIKDQCSKKDSFLLSVDEQSIDAFVSTEINGVHTLRSIRLNSRKPFSVISDTTFKGEVPTLGPEVRVLRRQGNVWFLDYTLQKTFLLSFKDQKPKLVSLNFLDVYADNFHLDKSKISYLSGLQGLTLKTIDEALHKTSLNIPAIDKLKPWSTSMSVTSDSADILCTGVNNLCLVYFHKENGDNYRPEFIAAINWPANAFKVEAKVDLFYIILVGFILITLYFTLYFVLRSNFRKGKDFFGYNENKVFDFVPTLKAKLKDTENTANLLRSRSDNMLALGILLGVGGVIASIIVFQSSEIKISGSWANPHTILAIVRPIILLVFVETFTFFFLKQHRIIFNEYKLFYSMQMRLLNYYHLLELHLKREELFNNDGEMLKRISDAIASEKFDLYENGTKSQINEFDNTSLQKAIDIFKDGFEQGLNKK